MCPPMTMQMDLFLTLCQFAEIRGTNLSSRGPASPPAKTKAKVRKIWATLGVTEQNVRLRWRRKRWRPTESAR